MSQHVLRIGDREYRAEVKELTPERVTVEVDGRSYVIDVVQLGRRSLAPEAARAAARPAASGPAAMPPPRAAAGDSGFTAPMPGLILAIKVKEGDSVQAGQALVLMEAMKMENVIAASYHGVVARVYVREGDSVSEGDLLVEVARPKMTTL